ncbi:abortive infection protein AbiGII [Tersicoccus phoenicis]|uniref:Abortive infection protein AbiGII n=1 Tax=Tersicoccus phoenicis TaxID=554083 RepID=A0A1R1LGM7_9MICC|nr:nucleotidyl transferase AbiEii/AbiGii toxin family protein [Tersicoccus phoenicis]OMH26697.1 abortive infection protein AbiGII [Tersicoccus phoenicis]
MNRPTRETPAGRAYLELQTRARRENRGTQELLTMYVVERWLGCLARSPYAADFVLKGGMLLASFGNRRPTVDADALARNMAADEQTVAARVAEIAALVRPDDGVQFLPDTISTRVIRGDAVYAGIRIVMGAQLAGAQLQLRLDVNFGDPVTPGARLMELPALRSGAEPIRLLGYPLETVLAEKLATAIDLGLANTRVRDYADVYALTDNHAVTCGSMRAALTATTTFRNVELRPLVGAAAGLGPLRASTYTAYRRRLGQAGNALPEEFQKVIDGTVALVDPVIGGITGDACWEPAIRRWSTPRPR